MNDNPYSPPESNIETIDDEEGCRFYVVSITKFTVLYFMTLGLYTIYWFYKNWKLHKDLTGSKIWPVARAIFNIFFAHKLFNEVQTSLVNKGKEFSWSPNSLATGYVVLTLAVHVSDRLSSNDIGNPVTGVLGVLLLPAIYFTLKKPQMAINLSQGDPDGELNSTFTVGNYLWIILGLLGWLMVLLGFLVIFGIIPVE